VVDLSRVRERAWRRGLWVAVGMLLVAGGMAAATVDEPKPTPVATRPRPTTTSTTALPETTTTLEPTTTTAAPAPSSSVVAAAPVRKPAAPRPPTTRKPAAPKPAPPPPAAKPGGITAMFYYGWYPSAFETQGSRFNYGAKYDSQDPAVVRRHIDQMRYAGMQAGIASWWGAGHMTDKAFAVDMAMAEGTPFKWTIYYEREGPTDPNPSVEKLRSDLQYILDRYARHPNYLRVDNKPVVFVWPDGNDRCEMLDRWNQANTLGFYVVQKRFPGYTNCLNRTHSWHDYSPDKYLIKVDGYSHSVGPGFYHWNEPAPRLNRDPAAFEAAVKTMAASGSPWKLVTTFNEWNEGTSVEPAAEWASPSGYGVYLDILNRHLGRV
jgi:hypothetical protein